MPTEAGADHVGDLIAHYLRMKDDDDQDHDRIVSFSPVPGQAIIVGYANAAHGLTLRVADVLGYTAEGI